MVSFRDIAELTDYQISVIYFRNRKRNKDGSYEPIKKLHYKPKKVKAKIDEILLHEQMNYYNTCAAMGLSGEIVNREWEIQKEKIINAYRHNKTV